MNSPVSRNMNIKQLLRYNIFILKILEFLISLCITVVLPLIMAPPIGHMYCISSGPVVIISLLFIELYILKRVPLFMEKMYLFFQIWFTFGAFIQCFILNITDYWKWLIYCPCYFALLLVLILDLYFIANERGCTFNVA